VFKPQYRVPTLQKVSAFFKVSLIILNLLEILKLINNSPLEVVLKFFVKGFGERSLDILKDFASELKISLYQ